MTMKRNVLILVVSLLSMVFQVANAQCVVKGKVVEQGTGTPLAYTNVVVYAGSPDKPGGLGI